MAIAQSNELRTARNVTNQPQNDSVSIIQLYEIRANLNFLTLLTPFVSTIAIRIKITVIINILKTHRSYTSDCKVDKQCLNSL